MSSSLIVCFFYRILIVISHIFASSNLQYTNQTQEDQNKKHTLYQTKQNKANEKQKQK